MIYTRNKDIGMKVKGKLKNKLEKLFPELKSELQIGLYIDNIEMINMFTKSSNDNGYVETVKCFFEQTKDKDIQHWYSKLSVNSGLYIEKFEFYNFHLWHSAKEYYDAAIELKEKPKLNRAYMMLLLLSLELFLKCIGTRIRWVRGCGHAVIHEHSHKLGDIYSNIKSRFPEFSLDLEEEYYSRFKRDFHDDLEINSLAFVNARYPYLYGGIVPKRPNPLLFTKEELLYGTTRRCDTDVCITALECASYFLYEKTSHYFNGS